MKLPNRYGTVTKLSGKRRKPYRVRKTIGWDADGNQKYVNIGYYATKSEALAALADFNQNPYDINASKATFGEVYEKWSEQHFMKVSQSNIIGIKSSIKICKPLFERRFTELKLSDYQYVFDTSGKNAPMLRKLKIVLSLMYMFAIKNEIVPESKKNIISAIEIKAGNPNKNEHVAFTNDEINVLWKYQEDRNVQFALMLIYGGFRINEFLNIMKEHVNIQEQYVKVIDSKTTNGIRTVPIADKVLPFYLNIINETDSKYLINDVKGKHIAYNNYYKNYWSSLMNTLKKEGMSEHKIHDTRHTTITLLTNAQVDERFIAKIVGHSQKSLAQKVYAHTENDVLLKEINKI